MDFMLSFRTQMLAQANAAEQVTGGQTLSMMVVLLTMATSLAMIVVWVARIGQSGHALPAAQRGILRVPVPLTFVAIGLSLLMIALMLLLSAAGIDVVAGGPESGRADGQQGSGGAEEQGSRGADENVAGDVSDTATTAPDTAASTPEATPESLPGAPGPNPESSPVPASPAPTMTPARMQQTLIDTAVMDLCLFVVLGVIVLVSRRNGRVRLSESGAVIRSPVRESSLLASRTFASHSFWPDLDDSSAIPQLPGYAVLGERTVLQPAVVVPHHPPYARATDANLTNPNSPYAPPQIAESTNQPELPDEPFSFFTELRFASEVFLAALVPTTLIKVIVVLITMNIFGEDPDQHPFLDMLDSGVGFSIMALILLTAVFMAPVVEELQFRVVMLGGLAQLGHPILALCLSSFLFAFAHGFPDSLALLPLAAALGYTYLRRRSYVTVMLVHFLFNGFNMAIALIAMV